MEATLRFSRDKSQFLAAARSRVDQHFKATGRSKNADARMWAKVSVFLAAFFGLYAVIISNMVGIWVMLPLVLLLGAASAFVGFNICHDAIHGSLSKRRSVNVIFSGIFHLVGASPYVWNISHNLVHHNFTNIPGHDEDLDIAPGLIRVSDALPVNRIQRYQHWYAFALYSLASLSWAFRKDYKKFFQARVGHHQNDHPRLEYFKLFFFKAVYYFFFIALPLLVLDASWWHVVIGFLLLHLAQGFTMGLVFQLAHVVEGTDFPSPGPGGDMEETWAEHQMHTTANFAARSQVAAFFLGGLNRQIEHHLFPGICHIHYGEVGLIVKQTAAEFGIPYIESPTFLAALRSHYRMLKKFGCEAA